MRPAQCYRPHTPHCEHLLVYILCGQCVWASGLEKACESVCARRVLPYLPSVVAGGCALQTFEPSSHEVDLRECSVSVNLPTSHTNERGTTRGSRIDGKFKAVDTQLFLRDTTAIYIRAIIRSPVSARARTNTWVERVSERASEREAARRGGAACRGLVPTRPN